MIDISGRARSQFTEIAKLKVELPGNGGPPAALAGVSNDGRRGYLAYLGGGFLVATRRLRRQPAQPADAAHHARPPARQLGRPGRPQRGESPAGPWAMTTDEVYGKLGGLLAPTVARGAGRGDRHRRRAKPRVRRVQASGKRGVLRDGHARQRTSRAGSHNPTLTPEPRADHLAFARVPGDLDREPARPRRLAEFFPEPLAVVQTEDPALSTGRDKVVMWSYPIVKDGLIYLIDLRNGLYILRYRGPCQEELDDVGFLEGNSNVGDALRFRGLRDRALLRGRVRPGAGAAGTADRGRAWRRPRRVSPGGAFADGGAGPRLPLGGWQTWTGDFRQAEEYLLSLELFGMRFGLDRMHRLMTVLGLPQRRFASIHVVGSNGKSSTVRLCAAVLERHGLRTAATPRRTCARSGSASRWGSSPSSRRTSRPRWPARRRRLSS